MRGSSRLIWPRLEAHLGYDRHSLGIRDGGPSWNDTERKRYLREVD
jgi:hypothetical protein